MDNLKSYLKKIKRMTIGAKPKKSYSQCGEDLIVQYIFLLRRIQKPSYLDIGANDPFTLSNTALFYQKGCRGINIEANPELAKQFKILRRGDINLNIGIGDKEEELNFYVMKDNTLSTFSKSECDQMVNSGKELASVQKVRLTTISKVIEQYHQGVFPDFLSLDVEGIDFDILQSINYTKSAPKVICVEAAEYSSTGRGERKNELIDFLVSKNYYEYANTNLNAIMVHRDFWFI